MSSPELLFRSSLHETRGQARVFKNEDELLSAILGSNERRQGLFALMQNNRLELRRADDILTAKILANNAHVQSGRGADYNPTQLAMLEQGRTQIRNLLPTADNTQPTTIDPESIINDMVAVFNERLPYLQYDAATTQQLQKQRQEIVDAAQVIARDRQLSVLRSMRQNLQQYLTTGLSPLERYVLSTATRKEGLRVAYARHLLRLVELLISQQEQSSS